MARRNDDDEIMIACTSMSFGDLTIHEGRTYRRREIRAVLKEHPQVFMSWANSTTGERRKRNVELMEQAGVYG